MARSTRQIFAKVKLLIEELGLEGANGVVTLAVKPSTAAINSDMELPKHQATYFKASAARSNYLVADTPEMQLAAKDICRFVAKLIMLSFEVERESEGIW